MPPTNPPASPIRLRLLNAQQQPLGGLVDMQITSVATGQALTIKAADASQAIPVPAASALPAGDYQVSVTPADGSPPTSHTVTIPAAGATPVDVVVDRGATTG